MSPRSGALTFLFLIAIPLGWAQLPLPRKLSPEDDQEFNKELTRLRTLLAAANDKCAVHLQIANTYAAGGQYVEAIHRLRELVNADLGIDPSRDPDFAKLRETIEFQAIMKKVRRQTPPVLESRLIATIDQRDMFPENIAFDPTRKVFFLGNTARDEIVRCSAGAACVPFSKPLRKQPGYVLGLKIDKRSGALWTTSNSSSRASLKRYDIETGKLEQTVQLDGKHVFNDLAVSSSGVVYVSDTREGSVYEMNIRTSKLRKVAAEHQFTAANGIALSPDEKMLYVSAWKDGIDVIDLQSESVKAIVHPANVCLAFIDGLYETEGNLLAIQNGPVSPRIVQFRLAKNGREIVDMVTLERRNPSFDGITTGALVNNWLYYVANPQTDKKNSPKLNPFQIFAVEVHP